VSTVKEMVTVFFSGARGE